MGILDDLLNDPRSISGAYDKVPDDPADIAKFLGRKTEDYRVSPDVFNRKDIDSILQKRLHDAAVADLVSGVGRGAFAANPGIPETPPGNPWQAQTVDTPQPLSMAPPQQSAGTDIGGYGQGYSPFTPQPQAPGQDEASMQRQPAQAPSQGDYKTPSIFDRLTALGQGYNRGGLVGGIGEAFGGQSPQLIEQQNETYKALIAKGVDPNSAKAAVLNPEVLKSILPNVFTPKAPATQVLKEGEMLIQNNAGPDGVLHPTNITPGNGDALQGKTLQGRQALAPKFGLKPGTVEYNAYVLNGKLPDVVPDHTAIRAATDQVNQSQHLLDDIEKAKVLNKTAYSGLSPESRAFLYSNYLPGSHPGAVDTNEFTNLVRSTILPSLKSTFPGRITNADLKLMEELQGSTSQSEESRARILNRISSRAAELHQEKVAEAKALREGTYYKPEGQNLIQQQGAPQSQPSSQFREGDTATGPNGERIVFRGGRWVGL